MVYKPIPECFLTTFLKQHVPCAFSNRASIPTWLDHLLQGHQCTSVRTATGKHVTQRCSENSAVKRTCRL